MIDKHYKTLGLDVETPLNEVQERYHSLVDEFDPDKQEGDLKEFFRIEQGKVEEAYRKILEYILESKEKSKVEETIDEPSSFDEIDSNMKDFVSSEKAERYSWWKYDDEYISGWQYFGRMLVGSLLTIILIGLYLSSVTAYKRSRSLGGKGNFFAVWGFLSVFIGLIPVLGFINLGLHWYLWFSDGDLSKLSSQSTKDITDESEDVTFISVESWVCKECGSQIDGDFDTCWHCADNEE